MEHPVIVEQEPTLLHCASHATHATPSIEYVPDAHAWHCPVTGFGWKPCTHLVHPINAEHDAVEKHVETVHVAHDMPESEKLLLAHAVQSPVTTSGSYPG